MKKALRERSVHGKRTDKRSDAQLVETDDKGSDDNAKPVERSGSGKALPEGKEHIIDKIPHRLTTNRPNDDMILV